jgi:Fe-S cluster assembly protein SufD
MNTELRAVKTKAEQALADAFAAAKPELPGKGALAKLREEAFRRFDAQGLPHRRVEEWKYTDLRALMRDAKPLAQPPSAQARAEAAGAGKALSEVVAQRLVLIDGQFAPDLSNLVCESGVTVSSMADALAKGNPLVASHVGKVFENTDPAVALNTALMGDGIVVHVAAGAKLTKPIHFVFTGSQNASVFIRSLIVVEKGASVFVIESHETKDAQVNAVLEVVVGDDAKFKHVKITSAGGLHVSSTMAAFGARASVLSLSFTPWSALVRNQMFVRFAGDGARAAIGGANLLQGRQHVDTTLVIDHVARDCTSRQRFKSVLDGESRAVFQGKIIVEPGAQKTDAKMMTQALLLSDEAEADNKPELEIFADDVQCGHGASVGALDQDQLFYLRARGIPHKEAEALLIQAMIGDVIDMVEHPGLRDALMRITTAWLGMRGR